MAIQSNQNSKPIDFFWMLGLDDLGMGLKNGILGILFVDLWVCYFDLGFVVSSK